MVDKQYHVQLDVAMIKDLHLLQSKISLELEHPIWLVSAHCFAGDS
jgi:hypothetical protein